MRVILTICVLALLLSAGGAMAGSVVAKGLASWLAVFLVGAICGAIAAEEW